MWIFESFLIEPVLNIRNAIKTVHYVFTSLHFLDIDKM